MAESLAEKRPRHFEAEETQFRQWLRRPELITVGLLILAFIAGSLLSPFFLDIPFLLDSSTLYLEIGVMAIGMTFIIISGNIDLSVASILALVATLMAVFYVEMRLYLGIAIVLALIIGALLGLLNGFLVAVLKLPSITVTIGTLAFYRGVAQILIGDGSLLGFPEWFESTHRVAVPGTPIPITLVMFLVLSIVFGIILDKTTFGRWVYAIGTNEEAARFSGIPVERVKLIIFTIAGFLSGLAGIMMASRFQVARFDHARGFELDVITAVVLGGTDIFGGRGSMFGTVVALFLLAVLRTGMGVANIKAQNQLAVVGTILIVSVLASNISQRLRKNK